MEDDLQHHPGSSHSGHRGNRDDLTEQAADCLLPD